MDTWSRSTPWRQGQFLKNKAAEELGLTDGDPNTQVIVITHDCDLTQPPESEPHIEVVVGKLLHKDAVDGNCAHAKNARKLHLPISGPEKPFLEIEATKKTRLPKLSLKEHEPSADANLNRESKTILQRWLASRYRRSAFPDEFERLFSSKHKLDKRIAKAGKRLGADIAAIYFDISNEDAALGEIYQLGVVILYNTSSDAESARRSAETLRSEIEAAFKTKLYREAEESWHLLMWFQMSH